MTTTMTAVSFELNDLDVELGGRTILSGLSLTARDGEFLCVVGRSGCGKTSLLRTIGGLVQPARGSVRVTPGRRADGTAAANCAIVFQADSLFPWMSVERNAAFGLRARGVGREAAQAAARDWLTRVGLPPEVQKLRPRQLSGGMRQRVNLVRALVLEPRVLLMDEPFASLDYQTREELQAELLRVTALNKMTTVLVTHDVPEAVLLADRIVVMDAAVRGIAQVFDVPWGQERSLDLKATSAFADLCGLVSQAVRGQR